MNRFINTFIIMFLLGTLGVLFLIKDEVTPVIDEVIPVIDEPVQEDPDISLGAIVTFGNTANDTSTQTNSTDRKYVYSATPSSSGTVVSGVARIWNTGSVNSPSHMVIYSDSAGAPNARLAVSDDVTLNTGGTETAVSYTFSGGNQISITSGTPYWIGVHFQDPGTGNINISRANTGTNVVKSDFDEWDDGAADPCACTTSSNGPLNLYIEYDDAAGGGGRSITSDVIIFE